MWKHKYCDGQIVDINNEGAACLDCSATELDDSEIYLDHYTIESYGEMQVTVN